MFTLWNFPEVDKKYIKFTHRMILLYSDLGVHYLWRLKIRTTILFSGVFVSKSTYCHLHVEMKNSRIC